MAVLEVPQLLQHLTNFWTDATFVDETSEGGHLLGPGAGASGRHHRLLVPTQESQGSGQVHDLAQLELQPIVRCFNQEIFPSTSDVNTLHLGTTVSHVRSHSDCRSEMR